MQRIGGFDGLRALAAYWVVFYHLEILVVGFSSTGATQIIAKGYLGVDVFFVLSGFVLSYVYSQQSDSGRLSKTRFYWARLARIYPMHILTLVAVLGLAPLNLVFWGEESTLRTDFQSLVANVLLIHTWGLFDELSWNFPSWSLSAEWAAYLVFPALAALSLRISNRPLMMVLVAMSLLGGWAALAHFLSAPERAAPFNLTYDFGLVRIAAEFSVGILLLRLYRLLPDDLPGVLLKSATPLLFGAILVVLHFDWGSYRALQDFFFVALAAALIFTASFGQSPLDRALRSGWARYFGEISYGIYLWHGVVIAWLVVLQKSDIETGRIIARWMEDPARSTGLAISLFVLLLSTGLAALSFRLFEIPIRKRMRGWWDRNFSAPGPQAPARAGESQSPDA